MPNPPSDRKERKKWRPIGDDGLIDTIQAFAGLTLVDCHHSKIRRRGRPPTYTAVARDTAPAAVYPSILVFLFFYCHLFIFITFFFPLFFSLPSRSFSVYLLVPPSPLFSYNTAELHGGYKEEKKNFIGRRHRGRSSTSGPPVGCLDNLLIEEKKVK